MPLRSRFFFVIWSIDIRGVEWNNLCRMGSGITGKGGGQEAVCPPETSDREIFADVSGKKRQAKKGKGVKIEKKRRKIVKGKVENWNWKWEKL